MRPRSRNSSAKPIVIIIWASGSAAKRRRKTRCMTKPIAPTTTMAAIALSSRLCVRVNTEYAT